MADAASTSAATTPAALSAPPDPVTSQLLKEKDQAQARQAIAEANATTAKATLPDLPAASAAGPDLGASGGGTLASVVANQQLEVVVSQIVAHIRKDLPKQAGPKARSHILLVSDLSVANSDIVLIAVENSIATVLLSSASGISRPSSFEVSRRT
jgi:hypothetical protein